METGSGVAVEGIQGDLYKLSSHILTFSSEAEWVTKESMGFHAADLTPALEVNKPFPFSSAPLPTIWGVELGYYMWLKETWEQGKNLEPGALEELGAQLWTLDGVWDYQEN